MLKPLKRNPSETLEKLKAIRKNYKQYHFELVGTQPSDIRLNELGVSGLEEYYKAKAQNYRSLKPKPPTLQNYCCLFMRMLRDLSIGDKKAVCATDVEYTMRTILALDALVKTRTEEMEIQIKSGIDAEKANKTFNDIRSLVRAISTLSSDEFIVWTQSRRNEHLLAETRSIVAQYRQLGFFKA